MNDKYGYNDIVDGRGALVPPTTRIPARPYEVVEELYGMIWFLAREQAALTNSSTKDVIETARKYARHGLATSPTTRYGGG